MKNIFNRTLAAVISMSILGNSAVSFAATTKQNDKSEIKKQSFARKHPLAAVAMITASPILYTFGELGVFVSIVTLQKYAMKVPNEGLSVEDIERLINIYIEEFEKFGTNQTGDKSFTIDDEIKNEFDLKSDSYHKQQLDPYAVCVILQALCTVFENIPQVKDILLEKVNKERNAGTNSATFRIINSEKSDSAMPHLVFNIYHYNSTKKLQNLMFDYRSLGYTAYESTAYEFLRWFELLYINACESFGIRVDTIVNTQWPNYDINSKEYVQRKKERYRGEYCEFGRAGTDYIFHKFDRNTDIFMKAFNCYFCSFIKNNLFDTRILRL